ncbi:MAG: PhoH family protein [Candidatus Marinimicrobia bacterium]|nr:PhoH family protein [Candidatus Neomarinimicrobiota bacterium]
MKQTFDIHDTEPLLLLGINDQHLQMLSESFDTTLVARGGAIIIEGKQRAVQRVAQVLGEMIISINRNGALSLDDVKTLAQVVGEGEPVEIDPGKIVVLYSHRGEVGPRSAGQRNFCEAAVDHDIVFAVGPAGTGKTYLAVAMAIAALKAKQVDRIILTRPAVEAGENLGFLPGDLKEKVDPYLTPLYDALDAMLPAEKLRSYLSQRIIEIAPLAYMRGRTLSSAYVILDEAQNATALQMKMFLTRLGANSRSIITGDITQIDLPHNQSSGLIEAIEILRGIDGIAFCPLTAQDVMRHRLVKDILKAYQDNGDRPGGSQHDSHTSQ